MHAKKNNKHKPIINPPYEPIKLIISPSWPVTFAASPRQAINCLTKLCDTLGRASVAARLGEENPVVLNGFDDVSMTFRRRHHYGELVWGEIPRLILIRIIFIWSFLLIGSSCSTYDFCPGFKRGKKRSARSPPRRGLIDAVIAAIKSLLTKSDGYTMVNQWLGYDGYEQSDKLISHSENNRENIKSLGNSWNIKQYKTMKLRY